MTLSNILSFLRIPLALLFLQTGTFLRLTAIFLAMITDSIDGYFARKNLSTSRFGAVLDPMADKFFVYFTLSTLYGEGSIALWQITMMLSRDLFLCIYGMFMTLSGKWSLVIFRAIRWGKVTTALQFIVLTGLVFHYSIPWPIFGSFAVMGWLAFLELFETSSRKSTV